MDKPVLALRALLLAGLLAVLPASWAGLHDKIDRLTDTFAIILRKYPPVGGRAVTAAVNERDPGMTADTNAEAARELLKFRVEFSAEDPAALAKWDTELDRHLSLQ